MELSLNVLEHLGINLYSNVPSVLSEVVANSWDADATTVKVTLDLTRKSITIQDDGIGMTMNEVNNRFLLVGYKRRDDQPGLTPKGRPPMGRKGIGKLSLFSVADVIEVYTVKDDQKSAFKMNLEKIREKIKEGSGSYSPEEISNPVIDFSHGTKIILSKLRRQQTIRTDEALRRRIARRFSILGPQFDFRVTVNGTEVTPSDRDYYDKIQYIWTYGDQSEVKTLCSQLKKEEDRTGKVSDPSLSITGWLGTVKESGSLKDSHGDNLNRIAIFVRGKLAQEDVLASFPERGIYADYLLGELHVDGLDVDEKEDAATSSRQSIVEDDPRFVRLREILNTELKHIQNRWSALREDEGTEKALEIPAVKEWIEGLPNRVKPRAKKWLGKLNRLRIDELDEQKQLIKHAILAFEFFWGNENLESLERIAEDNLNIDKALEIFESLDGLEVNLYGQIVQQRIAIIRTLQEKVDENALEKVIQRYIFDHLWLIEPSWERVDAQQFIETRVDQMIEKKDAGLTDEEKKARIDIKYRKTAGEHVIIELKRPDVVVDIYELASQVRNYRVGMLKILESMKIQEPVEIIILLGKKPRQAQEPEGEETIQETLALLRARIVYYDELLKNSYEEYKDYLDKKRHLDRLGEIISAIEDYAPPMIVNE